MWSSIVLVTLAFTASVSSLPADLILDDLDIPADLQREFQRLYDECPAGSELCICAFNIQTFGQSKMGKPDVVAVLIDIINRYDMVFIQEIRDIEEIAIVDLLNQCNAVRPSNDKLAYTMSARLGTGTSYKEQYAYYYRENTLKLEATYQYPRDLTPPSSASNDPDGFYDQFERPPYIAFFSRVGSGQLRWLGFIGCHVKPEHAPEEIDALVDVYDEVVPHFGWTEDVIIGGDLNAGCSYFGDADKAWNRLYNDGTYTWLIGDDANTNVASTQCPYDRLIIKGNSLHNSYVSGSAREYFYDDHMGITDEQLVKDVSDHYPVEMRIK